MLVCQDSYNHTLPYELQRKMSISAVQIYDCMPDRRNKPWFMFYDKDCSFSYCRFPFLVCQKGNSFLMFQSTHELVLFFPQERLAGVFLELGAEQSEAVPFHLLYQHPIIQDCVHMCQRFKALVRI